MRACAFVGSFAFVALVLAAGTARAESPLDEARRAYEQGATAYDRKDYATAASRFRDADEKVPNTRTLKLALASALLASDPALAMSLAERAESRGEASTSELVRRLRARFASEATRVVFSCPPRFECRAYVDGREVDSGRPAWIATGKHSFAVAAKDAAVFERESIAVAGELVAIAPTERELALPTFETAPRPPAAVVSTATIAPLVARGPDARLSPVWFGGAAIATTLAAGAGLYFTLQAKERHDEFVATPSAETAAAGDAMQTHARIAFVAAGGLALTTVVLALFTDFGGARRAPPVTVGVGDRGATLGGRF